MSLPTPRPWQQALVLDQKTSTALTKSAKRLLEMVSIVPTERASDAHQGS